MFQFQAIAQLFMKLTAIIFIVFALVSCNANKRWLDKGKRKGWLDTVTTVKYDTLHLNGSSKDSAFIFSNDTIWLRDKLFTTYYFRDTITHKETIRTIVHPRDTVVKVVENKTVVTQLNKEIPWWAYLVGGVMILIILILAIKK